MSCGADATDLWRRAALHVDRIMPGNLIIEAVRRGDGITYTARPFVERELKSGQLIELFSDEAYGTYYIKTRPGVLSPSAEIFIKWLRHQVAD